MPLTSGRMSPEHERKIRKCYIALKRDMDAKDLVDYFITEEIFDPSDSETINGYNPNTTSNRNDAFFRLLFVSGDRAYTVFLRALERNGQSHLAEMVENTVFVDGAVGDQGDYHSWIVNIPQDIQSRMLNDRDLSKLSQHLGGDWELVLLDLGLTPVDVSHAKMENPNSIPLQVFSALHKWKMKKPTTATLGNFLQACMNCQSVTINWNQIQNIVQQRN